MLAPLLLLTIASSDLWMDRVAPILSRQERALYEELTDEKAREIFRRGFFANKAVSEEEYMERLAYIDAKYGTDKPGSGANTDPGRLYLALGAPLSVQRLPSSRIFYPTEIWYYDHVPNLPVKSRLQFLFFRPRDTGEMKLFSPQVHTFRALVIQNAGTRGLFPQNDVITEGDILNRLNPSPAELDVVDAALGVAKGVRNSGNSEILYLASSPRAMLSKPRRPDVQSSIRFAMERPNLEWEQLRTENRIPAIDLRFHVKVRGKLKLEVPGLDSFETNLPDTGLHAAVYRHRLFLLPGRYNIFLEVDGFRTGYVVEVKKLEDSQPLALPWDNATQQNEIHYRANLTAGADWASIGRQFLAADDLKRASACFQKAAALGYPRQQATR